MHPSRVAFFAVGLAAVTIASRVGAETSPDPDLPQPLDLSVANSLIEKSPFTRALNLSEKLQLTGIAYVQGKPVATLMDRETKKNYVVSEEPNALGWTLSEASASTALKLTSVKLQVGGEVVTIHYGDAQIAPTSSGGSGQIGPSVWPSDAEAIRNDENGKPYVRGSAYLNDADRDAYYKTWSRESHEKFRDTIQNSRELMFKATPQQRAEYSKKVFDQINAEEKARGGAAPRIDGGSSGYRGGPPGGTSGYRGGGPPTGGGTSGYRGGGPPTGGGGTPYRGGGPR